MWGHTKITHLSMTSQNLGVKKSVITMEWTFFCVTGWHDDECFVHHRIRVVRKTIICIVIVKSSSSSSKPSLRYVWEKWEPSVNIYANCKVYTAKCQVQHFFSSTLLRRPPQVFAILGRANGAEKTFCICCLASILLSSHKIDVIAPIRVVNSIVKPF